MKYKISRTDGSSEMIQIVATTFKKLNVWMLYFSVGKEIMLYKVGAEWLQRSEDYLEQCYIVAIGAYIDRVGNVG